MQQAHFTIGSVDCCCVFSKNLLINLLDTIKYNENVIAVCVCGHTPVGVDIVSAPTFILSR